MKKFFILITFAFLGIHVFAQAPDKMTYQAVIRNSSNILVTSSSVGMQISILQGSPVGTAVFIERHTPFTNANGLATVEIGNGTLISGNFSTIDWSGGPYFIKTETDPLGGTTYTISGTSQLLSVPYALYAKEAENGFSGDYNDLSNAPTNVSAFTNDAGYLTAEVDGSTSNELQTISRTGLTVTLSNGGGSYTDSVNVYTAGNGITITGTTISTSGVTVGDVKQGYQVADHNGWYLLDGRALTTLPAIAQTNAGLLGIAGNLPDASNKFLADIGAVGSTGGSNSITIGQANLPNVNFTGTTSSAGAHTHTVDPSAITTTSDGSHTHDFMSTANDQPNSTSQGYPANGHEGIRTTDRQDLVITSTAVNEIIYFSGLHTHTVDVPSTASSSNGNHTHTVSVNSGGTGTAITTTPSYLSLNAFIYLGQ